MPKRLRSADICGFCLTYIYVWCFEFNISFSLLQLSHLDNVCPESLFYVICVVKKRVGKVRKRLFRVTGTAF